VTNGLDYRKYANPEELETALNEEVQEVVETETVEETKEEQPVPEKKIFCPVTALLKYYQGKGDPIETATKSIFGNDCLVGEKVYSVLVGGKNSPFETLGANKSFILPVKENELELVAQHYYVDYVEVDNEGVGVPALRYKAQNGHFIQRFDSVLMAQVNYKNETFVVQFLAQEIVPDDQVKELDLGDKTLFIDQSVCSFDGQKTFTKTSDPMTGSEIQTAFGSLTVDKLWTLVKDLVEGNLIWDGLKDG
jgi:hypothetical protein